MQQKLDQLFKKAQLSDALTRVLIPAKRKLNDRKVLLHIFDSTQAQKSRSNDFNMCDIAHISAVDDTAPILHL